MRKATSALAAVAVALVVAAPSLAWARPGHHGGSHHGSSGHHGGKSHHGVSRHHGGGSHHGGFRSAHGSRHHHHHRVHHHRGFHTKVFVAPSLFVGAPFYYPYYGYPYYYPAYVYSPPVIVQEPPVYIQQLPPTSTAPAAGYWYYCQSAGAYYPSVETCSEQWIQVVPRPQ